MRATLFLCKETVFLFDFRQVMGFQADHEEWFLT